MLFFSYHSLEFHDDFKRFININSISSKNYTLFFVFSFHYYVIYVISLVEKGLSREIY